MVSEVLLCKDKDGKVVNCTLMDWGDESTFNPNTAFIWTKWSNDKGLIG